MVPKKIAQDLLINGMIPTAEKHQFVAIFLSDIRGFSSFVDGRDPLNVFFSLDRIFSVMDCCVSQFPELYKIDNGIIFIAP
jgi:class 3 adenylate cyclase